MDCLLPHDFITSYIHQLENGGWLSYAHVPSIVDTSIIQYQIYNIKYTISKIHTCKNHYISIRKVFKFWEAVKLTVVQVFQTSPFYLKTQILSFITNMSVVFLKAIGPLDCFWEDSCLRPKSEEPQLIRCSHEYRWCLISWSAGLA